MCRVTNLIAASTIVVLSACSQGGKDGAGQVGPVGIAAETPAAQARPKAEAAPAPSHTSSAAPLVGTDDETQPLYKDQRIRAIANLEYKGITGEGAVQLRDGKAEGEGWWVRIEEKTITFGDVDGDGQSDAVVPIAYNTGGNMVLRVLAVVLNKNGHWTVASVADVEGQRTPVNEIAVLSDGKILARVVTHGPGDPFCCPSKEDTVAFRFKDGTLRKEELVRAKIAGLNSSGAVAGPLEDGKAAYKAKDYARAYTILRPLADKGEAAAQNIVGHMYAKGQGVPKDEAEAVMWFRRAAGQGDAKAKVSLGFMYVKGLGVPKNDAEALNWFREAAEQGDVKGQFNLGVMYDTGRGAPRDKAEAAKWYRKAAEQGHAKAADALANLRQAEIDLREGMDKVIGSWNCRTTNPNGLVSGETWTFGADRSFRFTDDTDTVLYGNYAQSGKNVTITIAKAERHLASIPTHQVIRADIISSSRGSRISMDTTTERGVKRKSTCTRI